MTNEIEAHVVEMPLLGDKPSILSPRFSRSWCGNGQTIRKVHGGIVNLREYVFVRPGQKNICRFESNEGWYVELQPVPQTLQFAQDIQCPEYHFTHHFCLTRTDSGSQCR